MQLVDSHCHLYMLGESPDASAVSQYLKQANALGVQYFLNVCVSIQGLPQVLAPAEQHETVWATVGLHPNHQDEEVTEAKLIELAKHPRIVGIGETGLDYYRSEGDLDWQRERFRVHIRAANALKKPLIVHTRNAKEDTIRIMEEEGASTSGGVMHCFTEDLDMATAAIEMGFYISFSGIVTFKNAETIQLVAKSIPLDRILLETDSPYLAPVPYRGKPNEPAYTRHTAEFIANLRGIELSTLADATTRNFFNLFKEAKQPHV